MTVYDYCHLGHARCMVCFDMMSRYWRYLGLDVNYVRNITDIDDKIIKRALDNGESISALTDRFIEAMNEDAQALGVLAPSAEPRATQYIPQIIAMIETLIERGFAYVSASGDVLYAVKKFAAYGQLAHKDLEGLRAGERVEIDSNKKDPLDFVLWKQAKPGEPHWASPWGQGRPGWHIECSAMSYDCLGETFDIHGGGFDLQFPHHENEIAQSCAATDGEFARAWLHVGFVTVNKEKMSKSLNNFFTIRDILSEHSPEVVRYFLLSAHYRSQVNYSLDALASAKASLTRLYTALRGQVVDRDAVLPENDYSKRFVVAMNDDFNTPQALAVLFELARDINREARTELIHTLLGLGRILGLLQTDPDTFLGADQSDPEVEALIDQRNAARAVKDWARSDQIRDELLAKGIVLEDNASGTTWRRV